MQKLPALLPASPLQQVCMHVASALCRHVCLGSHSETKEAAQKHKPGVLLLQRAGAGGAGVPGRAASCACSSVVKVQALLACPYPAWLHSLARMCALDIEESS